MKANRISGKIITTQSGRGIGGLLVEAWSAEKSATASIGSATTKKKGGFEILFESTSVREELARLRSVRFKIYQKGRLIKGKYQELEYIEDELDKDLTLKVVLEVDEKDLNGGSGGNNGKYTISGVVYGPPNAPVTGVTVKAFDQMLRSATQLGSVVTGDSGKYSISWTNKTKTTVDISIQVLNTNGDVLYKSTTDFIIYNAPSQSTLDIYLTSNPNPIPSEFDHYKTVLTSLVDKITFDQLGETSQFQDISFLAGESGLNYTYIGYFALSFKVQKQFAIIPEFTYALLRAGTLQHADVSNWLSIRTTISVNTDVTGLTYDIALVLPATVQADIAGSIAAGIVPDISKDLPGIQQQLLALQPAAKNYIQNQRPQQWVNLVTSSLNSGSYTGLVNTLKKNYYGNLPQLLNDIMASNPFPQAGAAPANPNAPVPPAPPQIDFTDLLNKAKIGVSQVNAVYQHSAFMAAFAKDDDHLFPATKAKILDTFSKLPKLNLGTHPIDTQTKQLKLTQDTHRDLRKLQRLYKIVPDYGKAKVLHKDGLHSALQITSLGKKQFVRKYTKNNTFTGQEATDIYRKASVTHSASVVLAGQLRDYASVSNLKVFNAPKTAAAANAAAPAATPARAAAAADGPAPAANPAGGPLPPPPPPPPISEVITQIDQIFPNLKVLFGDTTYCDCQDCRSVYSPAAYMVDVLYFLQNRLVLGGTKTAKDVLILRRPDLGDIDLNCDNAYTALPYIDLVCEILEQAVAPDPGLVLDSTYTADLSTPGLITAHLLTALLTVPFNVTAAAILYPQYLEGIVATYIVRDTKCTIKISANGTGWVARELKQTHLTAAELAAYPEYVNTLAYTTLQTADMSFLLPFDLFQEEAESLLETIGVQRENLMSLFAVPAALPEASIAAVAMGISPNEMGLIVNQDTANQFLYWNATAGTILTTVNEVDVFLQRSGLAYADLHTLLAQSFINPTGILFIQHEDSTCNTAEKVIAGLDLFALDRMHRFIRLWRKSGVSMNELNRVVTYPNLSNQQISNNTLIFLYGLSQLQTVLGITLDQSISFYGNIPDDNDAALYQSIFLNLAITNPVDTAFIPANIIANEALVPPGQDTLAKHLPTFCVCLRRKPAEITYMIGVLAAATVAVPPLTRANVAFLYSYHVLASSLGLSVQDMNGLSILSGQALFASPDATLAFVKTAGFLSASGFSVSDLQWFLTNQDPTGLLTYPIGQITVFLQALQTAYQAAFAKTASTFSATAAVSENINGLKQLAGSLPGFTTAETNQLFSIINCQWNGTPATAQTFVQTNLGAFFSAPAMATVLNDINTLLTAFNTNPVDPNLPGYQNTLIGDLGAGISLYLYNAAKQAALYAQVESTFGSSDIITQTILNYSSLHYPSPLPDPSILLRDLLTEDVLVDKVNTPPVPPAITPAAFDTQYRAVKLLNLILSYNSRLSLPSKDLQWLLQNAVTMGWLPLDQVQYQSDAPPATYANWYKLQEAILLLTKYPPVANPNPAPPTPTLEWTDVWNLLLTPAPQAQFLTTMEQFTGWDPSATSDLVTYFGYTYPATAALVTASSWADPATYLQMDQTTAALRLLGMTLSDFQQILPQKLGSNEVGLIITALRGKYSEAQWLSVIQPVMNALRPQKRDALVNYLLAMNPTLNGPDDLYDFFLVDVEMQAVQTTSRIVLAHGTLQLFIQRCLMALEPNATADVSNDDGWSQWSWMANYQVWVANRKIFLYPENWFEPDLRLGMSPFFSDLISDLQQNQVTKDTAEAAAINYMEKLDNVGNLDIRACYYDVGTYLFYVVARTKGGSTYYYRTCSKERSWSAWLEVKVDISGDCLICFVRNSRFFMAWPIFAEDTLQPPQPVAVPASGSSVTTIPSKRYLIQLAVSELVDGTWQPKRISQDTLKTDYYPNTTYTIADLASLQNTFRMINFDRGSVGDDIVCFYGDDSVGGQHVLGTFDLAGCKGYPEVVTWKANIPDIDIIPKFQDTSFLQMQYQQNPSSNPNYETTFTAETILNPFSYGTILGYTPSLYDITYPHEFSTLDWIYLGIEILTILELEAAYGGKLENSRYFKLMIPMASYMPFFYEDFDRDYVIIPGYFTQKDPNTGQDINDSTFSDIYQFVLNVIALIKEYILKYIANPNIVVILEELVADPVFINLYQQWTYFTSNQPQFLFRNSYHPLICKIKAQVYLNGLPSIMSYAFQSATTGFDFNGTYQPATSPTVPSVATPLPVEDIDFTSNGSYALYNWEMFYHLPFFVANQLSQNLQFTDALTWYQYIFNPTGGQPGSSPQIYWITRPFHEFTATDYANQQIDTILNGIAADPSGTTITDLANAVSNWRSQPFQPDVVASTRPVAYQKALVINYLQTLIAAGDNLFTQNTTESKVQATNYYVLANELMGPMPSSVPTAVPIPYETYNQLEASIDLFGNALIDMENLVPDLDILPEKGAELPPSVSFSLLYFCIPPNDTLTTLWSTIDDRLTKIRNSEDINGNFSLVPLFAPPIDPGLLVRATAQGLDISAILGDLNAPLPYYRFRILSQKATEFASLVSGLGNALLNALEKKDAEMLNQLRSSQEITLQTQIIQIRKSQKNEADQSIVELTKSLAMAQDKYNYYSSRTLMNGWEIAQAAIAAGGIVSEIIATVLDATSGAIYLVPEVTAGAAGIGGSPLVTVGYGGGNLGGSAGKFASVFRGVASILQSTAGLIGNIGVYQRRMDEWNFQATLAKDEMAQINQQIVVAQVRQQIAAQELSTQQTRIDQASAMDNAIKTKYTNEQLYNWLIGQISATYYQSYQLAYAMAKKAERCYDFELATESDFIQFGYWNSQQKGLLAGDHLISAIKQMESSYLDTNRREYELTKNVSLVNLDPNALLQLCNTGKCDFTIPEFLYDMDYPGQYLRRIKSVAISIPCISGPLTTIACTLTLANNEYRQNTQKATAGDPYLEATGGGDSRFVYGSGFVQAIATSSAINDNGLFELSFADERYLPFEGLGAISSWHLEMNDPNVFAQFDYQTITDIVIQMKYTAREGGSVFKVTVAASLKKMLATIANNTPAAGLYRSFDLKHDFPNNWYALMSGTTGTFSVDLYKLNFPFYTQNNLLKLIVKTASIFVLTTNGTGLLQVGVQGGAPTSLANDPSYGVNMQYLEPVSGFTPTLIKTSDKSTLTATFSNFATVASQIIDAWLIVNYELSF